jgi:hypothetical protein
MQVDVGRRLGLDFAEGGRQAVLVGATPVLGSAANPTGGEPNYHDNPLRA